MTDETVRLAVITRLGWIRRRQAAFAGQDRQSEREMVNGESHYVAGRRYLLHVVLHDGPASVHVRNSRTLELHVRPDTSSDQRRAALDRWYRARLREHVQALLARWTPLVGAEPVEWGIRRMKTRWGTCDTTSGRIWFNVELAKKPPHCTEYVVAHELVHLLQRPHDDVFQAHLTRLLPRWRSVRDELNRAPLAHEDWDY